MAGLARGFFSIVLGVVTGKSEKEIEKGKRREANGDQNEAAEDEEEKDQLDKDEDGDEDGDMPPYDLAEEDEIFADWAGMS